MNELTDEQIEAVINALPGIYFTEQSENVYMARAIIAADRAQRQAGQEPAAFDVQAEQIKRMQEVIDCLVEQKAAYAEAWSAMLATPPAAPVPEGFKLVPLEPTDAMCLAAVKASLRNPAINGLAQYRAMLAAAPDCPA